MNYIVYSGFVANDLNITIGSHNDYHLRLTDINLNRTGLVAGIFLQLLLELNL